MTTATGGRGMKGLRLASAVMCGALVMSSSAAAGDATVGRALYERGEGLFNDGGTASLQARSTAYGRQVLAGTAAACANCHGAQGQGGGEGSLRAPSLRWQEWASTSTELRASARERLRAALHEGRGADGRALAALMPRFDLDERSIDAVAAYLQALAAGEVPSAPKRRFALLQLAGAQALGIEREVHEHLLQCLNTRLLRQVEPVVQEVDGIGAVAPALALLQQRSDIVAVLAPPLREEAIGATPPLLFPLVGDPRPELREAVWLFGGPAVRASALLQAWASRPDAPEYRGGQAAIGVWADPATVATRPAAAVLAAWADAVERESGLRPRLIALAHPQAGKGDIGLWVDVHRTPPAGTWLVAAAAAASPPIYSRWWTAQPYPGQPPRPLAQRWAAAACQTVGAVLAADPGVTRERWPAALASIGRQRDASGWDWLVRVEDRGGLGATDAWSVIEVTHGARARVASPFVRVAPPRQ